MIGIALLFLLFICMSSIFVPALRKLTLCILATAAVALCSCSLLIGLLAH